MRLNPKKCIFEVQGGNFLGFVLTYRGIKANHEKCVTIIVMRSLKNLKEVQRLIGQSIALSKCLLENSRRKFHLKKFPKI